jgi:hypothetical protein
LGLSKNHDLVEDQLVRQSTGISRGDRVRSGVPVIQALEKVDEVRLLLGTELKIAYLPVRLEGDLVAAGVNREKGRIPAEAGG